MIFWDFRCGDRVSFSLLLIKEDLFTDKIMRKMMRFYTRFLWISMIGMVWGGCEREMVLNLGKGEALPVLSCVLRAGDDSVRVRVTWTKAVYDTADFRTEELASVWLYGDGEEIGKAVYRGGGWYVLPHRVTEGTTYKVEARVKERDCVWGETRVPLPMREVSITYDTIRRRVINWWRDIPGEKNYYWLSYCRGITVDDTVRPTKFDLPSYIETNSTLADPFNRTFDYEEEVPAEYDYFVRVEDAGFDGQRLMLEYVGAPFRFDRLEDKGYHSSYLVGMHFILSLDEHYDHYLRSAIMNQEYLLDMDDLPLFYTPLWTYSNVRNGLGLVASYVRFADVEERVLRKVKDESSNDFND